MTIDATTVTLQNVDEWAALRFFAQLPEGIELIDATLELYIENDSDDNASLEISLEAQCAANPYLTGANNISGSSRPRVLQVDWSRNDVGAEWRRSPSVKELVERYMSLNCAMDRPIAFIFDRIPGDPSRPRFTFRQWDFPGNEFAPKLNLEYRE